MSEANQAILVKDGLWVFDIIMKSPCGTTYNSYLLIGETHTALIECVKLKFFSESLERVRGVLATLPEDRQKIDFIIHNHTEPDHSGSSAEFLNLWPEAIVVGTAPAHEYLEKIWRATDVGDVNKLVVDSDDVTISLGGGHVLSFIIAPFLHWPDSMFTWSDTLKTIFTCDVYGSHYSFPGSKAAPPRLFADELLDDEVPVYEEARKYYYDCIFAPFSAHTISGIGKMPDDIEIVGCSHGPLHRGTTLADVKRLYLEWSEGNVAALTPEDDLVFVPFVSAYGFTGRMAELIADAVRGHEGTDLKVEVRDLVEADPEEVSALARRAKGLLLGTPTILSAPLPQIVGLVQGLNPIIHKGKIGAVFGSYGWTGEGTELIDDALTRGLKYIVPLDPLKLNFRGESEEDLVGKCKEFGEKFAEAMLGEEQALEIARDNRTRERSSSSSAPVILTAYPTDGKLRKWKCIICGEVIIAILPPRQCSACSAEGEIWVEMGIVEEIEEEGEMFGGIVAIVGAGGSGVSAAREIRLKNKTCRVLLFSEEGAPYQRPSVTKAVVSYVENAEWFAEQGIELIGERVVRADADSKELETVSGTVYTYDSLILATGSQAINNFQSAPNVFTIYSPEDVQRVMAYSNFERVVIIGGGLLGIEMSELLRELKGDQIQSMKMIEVMPRILPRQLDEEASAVYAKMLESHQIELMLGTAVDRFELDENGVATTVHFKDGTESIPADIILVTIGSQIDTTLFQQLGLRVKDGRNWVLTDDRLETSVKGVYAAGNIACVENLWFVIPNWTNAIAKGAIAGLNAIGGDERFVRKASPYTLLSYDLEAVSIGKVNGTSGYLTKKNGDREYMRLAFGDDGRLCGALMVAESVPSVKLANALTKKLTMSEAISVFF